MIKKEDAFKMVLTVGGHANSLGRVDEVIAEVLRDPDRLEELFACIFDDDAWVRMRAIDAVEKICRVHPEWLETFKIRIFNELMDSQQASIQWHVAQMFTQIALTRTEQELVVAWLSNKLRTTEIDWIVSGECMKALVHFEARGLVSRQDLLNLVRIQQGHRSKAIARKASTLLIELEKREQSN